jgi:hypothetical protein
VGGPHYALYDEIKSYILLTPYAKEQGKELSRKQIKNKNDKNLAYAPNKGNKIFLLINSAIFPLEYKITLK